MLQCHMGQSEPGFSAWESSVPNPKKLRKEQSMEASTGTLLQETPDRECRDQTVECNAAPAWSCH